MRPIYVQKISIYQNEVPLKLKEHQHIIREKRNNYEKQKKELTNVVARIKLQGFIHRELTKIKKFKREIKTWLIAENRSMFHRVIIFI